MTSLAGSRAVPAVLPGVGPVPSRAGIACPAGGWPRPMPRPLPRQVNDVPFRNLTREEAVQFLLGLPPGEDVELVTQRKQDSECARGRAGGGRAGGLGAHRASPVRSLPENGAVPRGRLLLHPHALRAGGQPPVGPGLHPRRRLPRAGHAVPRPRAEPRPRGPLAGGAHGARPPRAGAGHHPQPEQVRRPSASASPPQTGAASRLPGRVPAALRAQPPASSPGRSSWPVWRPPSAPWAPGRARLRAPTRGPSSGGCGVSVEGPRRPPIGAARTCPI